MLSAFSQHVQTLLKQDLVIGIVGRDLSSYFDVAGITAMANVSYFSDAAASTPVTDGENILAIKATIKDDKTKTIPGFTVSGTLQLKVVAKA